MANSSSRYTSAGSLVLRPCLLNLVTHSTNKSFRQLVEDWFLSYPLHPYNDGAIKDLNLDHISVVSYRYTKVVEGLDIWSSYQSRGLSTKLGPSLN